MNSRNLKRVHPKTELTAAEQEGDSFEPLEMEEKARAGKPPKLVLSASRGVLAEAAENKAVAGGTGSCQGYAYATVVNNGRPYLAHKMVTHSWRNKFTHLLAAILADALEVEMYDGTAQLLKHRQLDKLTDALSKKSKLGVRYWVCAFSVNQHAGICAQAPPADSSGHEIRPCLCATQKHFDGDLSEARSQSDTMLCLLL